MLPITITKNLSPACYKRWQTQFVQTNQQCMESIWRRTQDKKNADQSGWEGRHTARRRLVHYLDRYDMVKNNQGGYDLVITNTYLYLHVTAPANEIKKRQDRLKTISQQNNWSLIETPVTNTWGVHNGGVELLVKKTDTPTVHDRVQNRTFPESYQFFDVIVQSRNWTTPHLVKNRPWKILNSGFRTVQDRGESAYTQNSTKIMDHAPLQVELGCGPSIEAGLPPLHKMHDIYSVQDPETGQFVFHPDRDDLLKRILEAPRQLYNRIGQFYKQAIRADKTPFYQALETLVENNTIKEPIYNNNIDRLPTAFDVDERVIRRFEDVNTCPVDRFHPEANALLVVGSHADRRRVRKKARESGLKIIYVDPEGYHQDGQFVPYPLEAPQDEDLVINKTARNFARDLQQHDIV